MKNSVASKNTQNNIHIHTTEDFFTNTEKYTVIELTNKTNNKTTQLNKI